MDYTVQFIDYIFLIMFYTYWAMFMKHKQNKKIIYKTILMYIVAFGQPTQQ